MESKRKSSVNTHEIYVYGLVGHPLIKSFGTVVLDLRLCVVLIRKGFMDYLFIDERSRNDIAMNHLHTNENIRGIFIDRKDKLYKLVC